MRSTLLILGLLLIWTLLPNCAAAPAAPAQGLVVAEDPTLALAGTQAAYAEGNVARLEELREVCFAATADPGRRQRAFYFVGYLDSLLASLVVDEDSGAAGDYAEHGVAHLRAALELDPEDAESLALLSIVYGQVMQVRPLTVVDLGRRASRCMQQALDLEPRNPRVLLLHGVRLLNLPGLMGGDRARSRERFESAIEVFAAAAPPAPFEPSWGHADAHVWLAVYHQQGGDHERARELFARALELRPGDRRILEDLLPLSPE